MRKLLAAAAALLTFALNLPAEIISWQTMSNNKVTCMAESRDGNIWLGTIKGLNRYSGMEFISYMAGENSFDDDTGLTDDYITAICIDSEGRCWAGTHLGVNIASSRNNHIEVEHPKGTGYETVTGIKELNPGYMLVSTPSKLSKVDRSSLEESASYHRTVDCFEVVDNSRIWAVIYENDYQVIQLLSTGLEETGRITLPSRIASDPIKGSLQSDDGSVWFYTEKQIISFNGRTGNMMERNLPSLEGRTIQFVIPYKPGRLLVGLAGNGLHSYDIHTGEMTRIVHDEHLSDKSSIAFVDSNKAIWVSDPVNVVTIYNDKRFFYNIRHFLEEMNSSDIRSIQMGSDGFLWAVVGNELISLDLNQGGLKSRYSDRLYSALLCDSRGNMWVTENADMLKCCSTVGGELKELHSYRFGEPFFDTAEDAEGTIWIRFHDHLAYLNEAGVFTDVTVPDAIRMTGLVRCQGSGELFITTIKDIYRFDRRRNFTPLMAHTLDSPVNMAKDADGRYWMGTARGLVRYDPQSTEITRFDESDGVSRTMTAATCLGSDGNIWIVTSNDILKYSSSTGTFSNYVDNRFSSNSIYLTNCNTSRTSGSLLFAHTCGISAINPLEIPDKEERILELKSVKVGYDTFLTPEPNITFKHNQNMLNFWCSTSDPADGYTIEYKHFLEGYDEGWSAPRKNGWIFYDNLPTGEYVFHAAVRNSDGTWSQHTVDFPFRIKPHPLLSTFAIIIYFILIALSFFGFIWLMMHLRLRHEKIKYSEQREEMAKQHIDYLTDISHELKLPLTLIYAPVQELARSGNLSGRETDLLHLVEHNVGRMKVLTEQILDSGKYTEDKNSLQVASYNVGQLIKMVANNYRFLAIEKNISLSVAVPGEQECWLDFEKVVKILNNLLSNALKYTPDGGKVDISCENISDEGRLSITVTDNGVGIPEDKRQSIFDRFERLGYESADQDTKGSGVGLNYAQKLAKIHRGIITFCPSESGGSAFSLIIPAVKAAFREEEIVNISMPAISSEVFLHNATTGDIKEQSILIAEDDYELLMYLENLFSKDWNVIGANNGLEAMDSILQIAPDLVISDVSMPRKDGFELCREMKANDNVSHIPIILLTALGDVQSSVTGLESGADAYITKPFDPYYLLAEAKTLVRNRKRIQAAISNLTSTTIGQKENPEEVSGLKDSDRQFLERLHRVIDGHLSEEGFNASSLAKEMNNSYSNFYIKLKALTGQSPQSFLNTYKMNIAMELLRSGRYNVGEVAFKTGFSAISNFSRSFKKQFGVSPSEVK